MLQFKCMRFLNNLQEWKAAMCLFFPKYIELLLQDNELHSLALLYQQKLIENHTFFCTSIEQTFSTSGNTVCIEGPTSINKSNASYTDKYNNESCNQKTVSTFCWKILGKNQQTYLYRIMFHYNYLNLHTLQTSRIR